MIQEQVLSKVLNTKDFSIIEDNNFTVAHFPAYEKEFNYLEEHYSTYKNVPDKETFLSRFPEFDIIDEVSESDKFLVYKLNEEKQFGEVFPVLQKVSGLIEEGATTEAVELLQKKLKNFSIGKPVESSNIVSQAYKRYENFEDRKNNQSKYYFSTGFPELDSIIHGIQRSEELMIIFARINNGKSWILEKICTSVWQQGFNVGMFSPEMTSESIGYRFDTLHKNYSNRNLMWGKELEDEDNYKKYLKELEKSEHKFLVSTPLEFNNRVTISALKNWVKQNELDLLAIDGLSYIIDERANRKDNKTISLTNISEDLMSLSIELHIPVVAVVQANRGGVAQEDDSGTPELEHIRDSDGMAMNASKVLSLRQKDGILDIGIKKQRNGVVGGKITYLWDIDHGKFTWVPGKDDAVDKKTKEKQIEENKEQYNDATDVF